MNIGSRTIPDELGEHVFSFLGMKDLESVSRVCRAWRPLAVESLEKRAKRAVSKITILSDVWGESYDEKGTEMAILPWKQVFVDMQRMPPLMLTAGDGEKL